jgi:hypothetical protein
MLAFMAQELGADCGAKSVYRSYLRSVLGTDISHYRLSKMPDDLLDKFYGGEDLDAPQYLDFRPADIARLEFAVNKRVQIYRKVGGYAEMAKVYDRSVYDNALENPPSILKFLLTFEYGGKGNLTRLCPEEEPKNSRLSETFFITTISSKDCSCFLDKVLSALGEKNNNHEHGTDCSTLTDFCAALQLFEAQLPAEGLIIVSYLSTKFRVKHSWKPGDQTFGILGVFGGKNPIVVCFTSDVMWCYKVKEDYAAVIKGSIPAQREQLPRSKWAGLPHDDDDEEMDEFSSCHVWETECDCGPCSRSGQFAKNMKSRGRQKIYSFPMSSFDGLKMFGLFSPETEEDILFCTDVSIAAWDSEALTVPVSQECGNEDLAFPFETVGHRKYPREAVARQEPILVSWADQSMLLAGQEPIVYEVEDDEDPSSDGCFAARFIKDLLEARNAASKVKRLRLSKLLDFLSVLRQAHDAHFAIDPGDPEIHTKLPAIDSAWRNSLFGLFQMQLERLINRWVVFGFNAEVGFVTL